MKPTQFNQTSRRMTRIDRGFPITDWNYSAGFGDFKARCARTSRSSFAEISRDYFKSEARRGFIFESVLFALIIITVTPAMLDCGRALLEFTRVIGAL
jgi:hypothetical protein